jgi:hypothetical protein
MARMDPRLSASLTALASDGDADRDLQLLGQMLAGGDGEACAPRRCRWPGAPGQPQQEARAPAAATALADLLMVPVPDIDIAMMQSPDAFEPRKLDAGKEGEAHARKHDDDIEWEPDVGQHTEAPAGGHKRRRSEDTAYRLRRRDYVAELSLTNSKRDSISGHRDAALPAARQLPQRAPLSKLSSWYVT